MNNNRKSGANAVGHKNIFTAVATAIYDRFSNRGQLPPLREEDRIDGKVCLVTGANSGLGMAVAIQLAQRGGHVIMACRGGHPDAGEAVKKASGSSRIEMLKVDLADLESVQRLCDQLRDRGTVIDIAVLNAGLMPLNARRSPQGFELMFTVHFLANRLLLERWLADGVIRPGNGSNDPPRVIFVSSEAHQSAEAVDFDRLGEFVNFGIKDGMKHYGISKLLLCTYANELSRRCNGEVDTGVSTDAGTGVSTGVRIAVHALCPGPIASAIARESPAFIKPLLVPVMKLLFRSPQQAAEPVLYLACAAEMGQRTGAYLHMMREKSTSQAASDPRNGQRLWEQSHALLQPFRRRQKVASVRPVLVER